MKYPNLRYGNPAELQYYAMDIPVKDLAKRLRRSQRSVRDWMTGKKKVPWWVPEIIRLQRAEHQQRMYQMNMRPVMAKLGIATPEGQILSFVATSDGPQSAPSVVRDDSDQTLSIRAA